MQDLGEGHGKSSKFDKYLHFLWGKVSACGSIHGEIKTITSVSIAPHTISLKG